MQELNRNLVRTGGCQCGAVRFRAGSLLDNPHICHCRMCQKAAGNFFAALVGVPLKDFAWTRGVPAAFRSSDLVERGYCRDCGTPLFFKHDHNKHISMTIGSFDRPQDIPLAYQLGMEGRLPQIGQIADLVDYGATEDEMPEEAAAIRAENRQHPDHETDVFGHRLPTDLAAAGAVALLQVLLGHYLARSKTQEKRPTCDRATHAVGKRYRQ